VMSAIKAYTAIFLIAFVIFPCVSADDDVIRLQALNINATNDDGMHGQHRTPGFAVDLQLDRMLEEHTTFQVTTLYAFALCLSFCSLVCSLIVSAFRRELPAHGGRAPPSIAI
jgi:hypothetical protein